MAGAVGAPSGRTPRDRLVGGGGGGSALAALWLPRALAGVGAPQAGQLTLSEAVARLTRYPNCVDMLAGTGPQLAHQTDDLSARTWGNGFDCRSTDEPLSREDQFCNGAGWTCAAYEAKGWCTDGVLVPTEGSGLSLNNPEVACCACGGGLCEDQDHCWFTFPGVVEHQGQALQPGAYHRYQSLEECKRFCDTTPTCRSLLYSSMAGGWCHLRDRCVTEDDRVNVTASHTFFHTYYKPCDLPPPGRPPRHRPRPRPLQQQQPRPRERQRERARVAEASGGRVYDGRRPSPAPVSVAENPAAGTNLTKTTREPLSMEPYWKREPMWVPLVSLSGVLVLAIVAWSMWPSCRGIPVQARVGLEHSYAAVPQNQGCIDWSLQSCDYFCSEPIMHSYDVDVVARK